MKSFLGVQALLLVLYLIGTDGRHTENNEYEDLPEAEEHTELINRIRDHATQMRHRRRSRQMYSYDYQPPYQYDNRRDYNVRQQEEYFSRIVKSLDEIINNLRRPPPPPPQPVYIPYPVIHYRPCVYRPVNRPIYRPGQPTNKPNLTDTASDVPNLPDRFPDIEDENQLWGSPIEEIPEYVDGEGDGSRPISFDPLEPNRPTSRPPPPVDHGSNQAGNEQTTAPPVRRPGACETAILTCCSMKGTTAQRNCFARYDCVKTYATNRACDPTVIQRVLDHFTKAYAPLKND